MHTEKQKRAVEEMIKNGGVVSKAMRAAGYSEETSRTPQKLTESKGFAEICEEYGLTDSLIIRSLVDDIKGKPLNRKAELELGAKLKGLLVERKDITTKGLAITFDKAFEKYDNSTDTVAEDSSD